MGVRWKSPSINVLVKTLGKRGMTIRQIAECFDINRESVYRLIREAENRIYISAWVEPAKTGQPSPVYSANNTERSHTNVPYLKKVWTNGKPLVQMSPGTVIENPIKVQARLERDAEKTTKPARIVNLVFRQKGEVLDLPKKIRHHPLQTALFSQQAA